MVASPQHPQSGPPDAGDGRAPRSRQSLLWRLAVPLMATGAGLLFGVSASLAGTGAFDQDPEDLPTLIRERAGRVEGLTRQVEELQLENATLGQRFAPATAMQEQADVLSTRVGTAPVTGPAVRVTLDDAGYTADTIPEGYTVDDVVVHQQDLQAVVNALWAGGAEAMVVMDQRIVATSSVQCVGNTLYLQGRVYSPPFTVTAVGEPEALLAALEADPVVANYRGWAAALGLGYEVEALEEVQAPAFGGTLGTRYAQVGTPPPQEPADSPFQRR